MQELYLMFVVGCSLASYLNRFLFLLFLVFRYPLPLPFLFLLLCFFFFCLSIFFHSSCPFYCVCSLFFFSYSPLLLLCPKVQILRLQQHLDYSLEEHHQESSQDVAEASQFGLLDREAREA